MVSKLDILDYLYKYAFINRQCLFILNKRTEQHFASQYSIIYCHNTLYTRLKPSNDYFFFLYQKCCVPLFEFGFPSPIEKRHWHIGTTHGRWARWWGDRNTERCTQRGEKCCLHPSDRGLHRVRLYSDVHSDRIRQNWPIWNMENLDCKWGKASS